MKWRGGWGIVAGMLEDVVLGIRKTLAEIGVKSKIVVTEESFGRMTFEPPGPGVFVCFDPGPEEPGEINKRKARTLEIRSRIKCAVPDSVPLRMAQTYTLQDLLYVMEEEAKTRAGAFARKIPLIHELLSQEWA